MRLRRGLRRVLGALAAVLLVPWAVGQPEAMHGWAVLDLEGAGAGEDRFVLAHIPPRSPVALGDGRFMHAGGGEVRLVSQLGRRPDWIVPSGRAGYLFFEGGALAAGAAGPDDEGAPRAEPGEAEGLRVSAVASALGDTWATDAGSRLSAAPALPGEGEVVGLTGIALGPLRSVAALIGDVGPEAGVEAGVEDGSGLRLFVLQGASWTEIGLPEGVEAGAELAFIHGEGLSLIDRASGVRWDGTVAPGRVETALPRPGFPYQPSGRTAPAATWRRSDRHAGWAIGDGRLFGLGREIAEVAGRDEGLDLFLLDESGPVRLGSVEGPVIDWVVVGERGAKRLVAVLEAEGAFAGGAGVDDGTGPEGGARVEGDENDKAQKVRGRDPRSRLRVVELSLYTGAPLYGGPVRSAPPVSPGEFRLLALVILGVMVLALLFVLRPDGESGVAPLPPEASLCDPGRRMGAGAADVLIALLVGSVVSGLFGGDPALGNPFTLLCGAGVFLAHGVLGEWLTGRTIGKALAGCAVVSSSPKGARAGSWSLSLTQALTRNVFKVVLPPIALLGVGDRSRRHRGDVLARTSVVMPIPPEEGDGGGE